jgi:hypothetical protein
MLRDPMKLRAASFEIIPFPAKNRVGHIRRTADRIFNSRTNREAEAYWKRAVDGLHRQMEKADVPEARIEAELRTFHDCVQAEMGRLARRMRKHDGDVA